MLMLSYLFSMKRRLLSAFSSVCWVSQSPQFLPEPGSPDLELKQPQQVGEEDTHSIEPESPRRWRLILNYQDHTAMQYDIVKRDQGYIPVDTRLTTATPARTRTHELIPLGLCSVYCLVMEKPGCIPVITSGKQLRKTRALVRVGIPTTNLKSTEKSAEYAGIRIVSCRRY